MKIQEWKGQRLSTLNPVPTIPQMNKEEIKSSPTEAFYIESASTGRFRRSYEARDSTLRWRLPMTMLPNQNADRSNDRGIGDKDASKIFFAVFLFLQGILSGLSLSALYEAFASMKALDFILHSATRVNEIRRYFFIGINFCTVGESNILSGWMFVIH